MRARRRHRSHVFVLALAAVTATSRVAAQTPARRAPLKEMRLGGPVSLTIAGQARWREEFFRAFNTLPLDDDNGQSRLLLSADVLVGDRRRWFTRLFAEGRDAQSYGRTLPGGARPQDADRHDVQNLYLEAGHGASWLRVGRQEIAVGRERLIGVPDWSNTRRGSQGARLQIVRGRFALEAIDAHPMVVRQAAPNRPDSTQRFRTLSLGSAPGARPLARGLPALWQGYWYTQRIRPVSGTAVDRTTAGGRLQWTWGATSRVTRSLEFEGALQRGEQRSATGTRAIHAGFWVTEAQLQWKRTRGAPSLALAIEEATGEDATTTNRVEAFAVLYPAAHAHGGYADVIGRTNVRELHAIGTWDPWPSLNLRGALYRFDRLRLGDGVYNKANAVFRASGDSRARHVADELDVTGTWRLDAHWRVIFGGALVVPGAFLEQTTPIARTERWGFVGTTFGF